MDVRVEAVQRYLCKGVELDRVRQESDIITEQMQNSWFSKGNQGDLSSELSKQVIGEEGKDSNDSTVQIIAKIKSITDLCFSKQNWLDYDLINEVSRIRTQLAEDIAKGQRENMAFFKQNSETLVEHLFQNDADGLELSIYQCSIRKTLESLKSISKSKSDILTELFQKYEEWIIKSLKESKYEYKNKVDEVTDSYDVLNHAFSQLRDENDFLSKQLVDYKNDLANEKAALKWSSVLFNREIELKQTITQKYENAISKVSVLLPNYEKMLENKKFIRKCEMQTEISLDKKLYDRFKVKYNTEEVIILQDVLRLSEWIDMPSPLKIENMDLKRNLEEMTFKYIEVSKSTLRNLQDAFDKTSDKLNQTWNQKQNLEYILDNKSKEIKELKKTISLQNNEISLLKTSKVMLDIAIQTAEVNVTTKPAFRLNINMDSLSLPKKSSRKNISERRSSYLSMGDNDKSVDSKRKNTGKSYLLYLKLY